MTGKIDHQTDSPLDLAWTKLLDQSNSTEPVIIQMENPSRDSASTPSDTPKLERKPTWLGSIHKHLMLLKNVTDSPGPITRY